MNAYKVQPGQSVIDVCLQLYGTGDYLVKLMQDNDIDNVHADIVGQILSYNITLVSQAALFNKNINTNTIYATWFPYGGSFDNSFDVSFMTEPGSPSNVQKISDIIAGFSNTINDYITNIAAENEKSGITTIGGYISAIQTNNSNIKTYAGNVLGNVSNISDAAGNIVINASNIVSALTGIANTQTMSEQASTIELFANNILNQLSKI